MASLFFLIKKWQHQDILEQQSKKYPSLYHLSTMFYNYQLILKLMILNIDLEIFVGKCVLSLVTGFGPKPYAPTNIQDNDPHTIALSYHILYHY